LEVDVNTLFNPNETRQTAWWTDADAGPDAAGMPIPGVQGRFWRGAGIGAIGGLAIYALAVFALWAVLRWL
jgi:hypothetical protein